MTDFNYNAIFETNHTREEITNALKTQEENNQLLQQVHFEELIQMVNAVKTYNLADLTFKMQKLNTALNNLNLGINEKSIKNLFANLETKKVTIENEINQTAKAFSNLKDKGKYEQIANLLYTLEKRVKYNNCPLEFKKVEIKTSKKGKAITKKVLNLPYEVKRTILTGNPKSPEMQVKEKISKKQKILYASLNFNSKTAKIQINSNVLLIQKRKNQIEELKTKIHEYTTNLKIAKKENDLKKIKYAKQNLKNCFTKLHKKAYFDYDKNLKLALKQISEYNINSII